MLPVYDLVYEHIKNLSNIGVNDYMLTWTLGGYPSLAMLLVADFSANAENFSLDEWYKTHFGTNSDAVKLAVKYFSNGFFCGGLGRSIKGRMIFERKKSVLALACEFGCRVFSAYKKFVSRNRLLLSCNSSTVRNDEMSPELLYEFGGVM